VATNVNLFPQANAALQKPALRLNLAGSGQESPILAGLAGRLALEFNEGEILDSWRIYSGDEDDPDFENVFTVSTDGQPTLQDIVFGTDTDTGTDAVRNYLEWITNAGKTIRQFWVQDLPGSESLYVGNQEAQGGDAVFQISAGEPVTLGINIMPNFTDEFFQVHEATANRWTNTLRSWGGALTAEVILDTNLIISERYVGNVHGHYWPSPGAGSHEMIVRLRAAAGSVNFVEIDGTIRVEYV
jgi:hypothetical protein